jgi:hypothetical protein
MRFGRHALRLVIALILTAGLTTAVSLFLTVAGAQQQTSQHFSLDPFAPMLSARLRPQQEGGVL